MDDLAIRTAYADDLPLLHPLIERAYRGEAARAGWSHEADLIEGPRIAFADLAAIAADPTTRLLVALGRDGPVGCVQVSDRGDGIAYLGLLCIDPVLQAAGLGRRLIAAAEGTAIDAFAATRIEMTVIDRRTELIAYYGRRGYAPTGETRPFPIALEPPLRLTVLDKALARSPIDDFNRAR